MAIALVGPRRRPARHRRRRNRPRAGGARPRGRPTPRSAQQFGRPIGEHQGLRSCSPTWRPPSSVARATYLHAARLKDAGRPFSKEAAVAKLVATDAAMRVTTDAVQVLGGDGYTQDFPRRALHARGQGDPDLRGHQPDPAAGHRPPAARADRHERSERPPCRSTTPPSPSSPAAPPASAGRPSAACTPTAPRSSSSTCPSSPGAGAGRRARRPASGFVAGRRARRGAGAGRDRRRRASSATLRIVVNCAGVGTPGRVVGKRGPLPLEDVRERSSTSTSSARSTCCASPPRRCSTTSRVDGDRGVIVMTASHRRLRRPDRPGRVRREQGRRRRPHPDGRPRPRGQGDPRHDDRPRHLRDADARRPARRGEGGPRGAGAAPVAPRPARTSTPTSSRHIVDNPMLNGEVIRLDGALRMPPR